MSWFNGWHIKQKFGRDTKESTGQTLISAIDSFLPPTKTKGKALRLSVSNIYNISGIGTVPTAVITCGQMKPGMKISFSNNITTEVKSIEMHHNAIDMAETGHSIGFNIADVDRKNLCRGIVVGDAENDPPKVCKSFVAQIILLNHPGTIHKG